MLESLFELQRSLITQFERTEFIDRHCFNQVSLDNRITGLVGARGIGKTTFLLHKAIEKGAKDRQALYLSADSYYLLETPLLALVDKLNKETDVRLLCVDEVHKYTNWNQELKNIADSYRDFRLLFSGSSMIDIIRSKYDLSRRVTLKKLHGFSFREYLEYSYKIKLPVLELEDIISNHEKISDDLDLPKILKSFHEYLRIGYYPFFIELNIEQEKYQAIENSVQKTIYEDIANIHSLKTPTLSVIEKLYKYVTNSLPGEISAYKLASTLGKDYESISEYFVILEQAGLISFVHTNKSGKAMLRNPTKMYSENPNQIYAAQLPQSSDTIIGKARETFAINQLMNAQHQVFYSEKGDFRVEDYLIEVGGKNKNYDQIKHDEKGYLFCDGIITGLKKKVPLYLLGFLY